MTSVVTKLNTDMPQSKCRKVICHLCDIMTWMDQTWKGTTHP